MYILVSIINGKETKSKHFTIDSALSSGMEIVGQFMDKQSELERLYLRNPRGEIVWSHSFEDEESS